MSTCNTCTFLTSLSIFFRKNLGPQECDYWKKLTENERNQEENKVSTQEKNDIEATSSCAGKRCCHKMFYGKNEFFNHFGQGFKEPYMDYSYNCTEHKTFLSSKRDEIKRHLKTCPSSQDGIEFPFLKSIVKKGTK
jgi:hypothetical protein